MKGQLNSCKMNEVIISDEEVSEFFLAANKETHLEFLQELETALQRYSANPAIIPPRIKGCTPSCLTVHLYMPVIDDVYSGVKSLGYNASSNMGFVGSINVTDAASGALFGALEAKQVTGVRTALTSCIGLYHQLNKFENIPIINCTVFGSGLQAFWHIFFASQLFKGRCESFKVNVLYRKNPMDLEPLLKVIGSQKESEEVVVEQFPLSDTDKVRTCVATSHVIFGCIPSPVPNLLFRDLAVPDTEVKHTYISLIGSYQTHMHECDDETIMQFKEQGVPIIVDSKEHTPLEAGELYDNKVRQEQLIEIGELAGATLPTLKCPVSERTVTLCKIVGLAIMDICVSKKLLEICSSL